MTPDPRQSSGVVELGDCIEVMRGMDANSVDAIVTDPPYGLGFMGKAWDALPPGLPWAQECLRVLKPGGHLLAFGGTRTSHRLVCAIEDAGFEIRDTLAWLHGQGFPKGNACLKPAHEPITLARKGRKGPLNVDGCRIAYRTVGTGNLAENTHLRSSVKGGASGFLDATTPLAPHAGGRWPANVCMDVAAAAALDEQTHPLDCMYCGHSVDAHNDDGSCPVQITSPVLPAAPAFGPSRFFYVAKPGPSERSAGLDERNTHPTVKPIDLMRWLVRLVTPPGGTVLDPFTGSGTTGIATVLEGFDFIGIEREPDYVAIAAARIAHWRAESVQLGLDEAA